MMKNVLISAALLAALGAQSAETRVFVLRGSAQKAIHRFTVTNPGEANETWTETTPLCTFASGQGVNGVFPAHGYYYVCIGATVYRYSKEGKQLAVIGGMGNSISFEMSADQAYMYGSDMTLSEGHNCVRRLHLGSGNQTVIITNSIAQARGLSWGGDGLLYVSSRSTGNGVDFHGNAIKAGQYRGITAFDVTNGDLPLLKHHYTLPTSWGHGVVDGARKSVYGCGWNAGYVFGIAEESPDGEVSQIWRAQPLMTNNNCFAGAMIAGHAYTADWKDVGANIHRFNPDGTATLVATILNTDVGGDGTLSTIQSIHEDVFPEDDTTIALTKLSDYWSFNHCGVTSTLPGSTFTSQCNPKRNAVVTSGFTAGVQGVVREGLWCAAGAKGTLASAVLVGQTNDWTITTWVGFPKKLEGAQILFSNPKVTILVTAAGLPTVEIPDGKDIAGAQATGASALGTTSIADGQWHQVAISRRDYKLEVWVDGALEGTSAKTTVATYDDINTQWSLLNTANRNPMFLDEVRFYGAALAANDLKLLRGLATNGLNVPRDPATRSDEQAKRIGSVVAYSDPANHTWGVPMVVVDADGSTLYAAADFARGKGENNQGVVWKSSDGGENWTRAGGVSSLGEMALFRFDSDASGTFRSVAHAPDGGLVWCWSTTDGCKTFTTARLQSAAPLTSALYPAPCPTGYARNVATDSGIFNLDALAYGKGYLVGCPGALSNTFNVAGYRAGGAFDDEKGTPTALYHQTVKRHQNATNALPLEVLGVVRREAEKGSAYRGAATFPGASRPFGVIWDAASARYWAVVTYAEDASQTPWKRANRLALYSAKGLTAWEKCRDLAVAGTPETVGFNTPNLVAVGDDLVVVFGASINDTTGADVARDVNRSNYILSKRIANFRQLAPADDDRRTKTLLISDSAAGRILRLVEDPDNPDRWMNAGYFAEGSFSYGGGTDTMGGCDDIKVAHHKAWILKSGRLYCFNTDGSYTETCYDLTRDRTIVPYNPDGLGLSYDRRYAYTCSGFLAKNTERVKYIYRTDLTTGETIQFCKSTDPGLYDRLYMVRAVEGLPDGSVAVACRDGNKVFRLTAEGEYLDGGDIALTAPQTLFYDRHSHLLYVSGFSGKLYSWDYLTGAVKVKEGLANVIGITGDGKGRVFGTSYNAPAGIADLLADNGALTTKGHREILLGGNTFYRCCYFDSRQTGLVIFVK